MDLKDFVVSAIEDIASAVKEADDRIKPMGGLANPGKHQKDPGKAFVAPRTTLNFDIAVSATTSTGGGASAKAKILVVEASMGGDGQKRMKRCPGSRSRLTLFCLTIRTNRTGLSL